MWRGSVAVAGWLILAASAGETALAHNVAIIERPTDSCESLSKGDALHLSFVGVILGKKERVFTAQPELMTYTMGSKTFVPGWEYGLEGSCAGEKRTVTIPPALAYGEQGLPPHIPPNATLRFHIEILSIVPNEKERQMAKEGHWLLVGVSEGMVGFACVVFILLTLTVRRWRLAGRERALMLGEDEDQQEDEKGAATAPRNTTAPNDATADDTGSASIPRRRRMRARAE